jgi:N6-adenosine-specific RNA methylase IME4
MFTPQSWPFGALKPFSYDFIMIDPPWPTKMRSEKGEAKSFARHYGAMSFDDIAALPVANLMARDCVVFLWCTWPHILYGGDPERHYCDADASISMVGRCIRQWGLRYVTGGGWEKLTVTGKQRIGTGYRVRSVMEPFLLCVTGSPQNSRSERNLIKGLAREHSRKPDEAFAWAERYMPEARRCELFSRQSRPGWDTWGLEAGKFDPVVHENARPLHPEPPALRVIAGGRA